MTGLVPLPAANSLVLISGSYYSLRYRQNSRIQHEMSRENFLDLREVANAEFQSVYLRISLNFRGQGSCAVGSGFYWAG
jgi:hypothetical protein